MDIKCIKCGEPWAIDSLHDAVAEGLHESFAAARDAFYKQGCTALGERCGTAIDAGQSNALSEVYALLGDDIDGTASFLEDAGYLGLL
jgi:hypothetical protein